jgi:GNAT superfamily N-acetyltransferase
VLTIEENAVFHNGTKIGKFVHDENHIEKIELEREYQGVGYGTRAIQIYLKEMADSEYDRVTTTLPTAPEMKHIFEKLGFQRIQNPAEFDFLHPTFSEDTYLGCYVFRFFQNDLLWFRPLTEAIETAE